MLFPTYPFLFGFLPAVLVGFFLLGRWAPRRAALGWLALASLVFYGWWSPAHVLLLLFSIGFNFTVGRFLGAAERRPARVRRAALGFGLSVNLGLLAAFKYTTFFARELTAWFDLAWNVPDIVLPLAISFFTFQQIAYLCDAYQGYTREYHFIDYCLFVAYFPQLIAGPIVHHQEVMPQFTASRCRFDPMDLAEGVSYFIIGLFKKVVLADNLALFSTPVFAAAGGGADPSFAEAWGGVLAYTFQIYFDFSGYSDMAIGLAWMIGIRLPVNFHSPYRSPDIAEFWRRWHITLSRFLRDYLYVPLGGNRGGRGRQAQNLMITMLLGGLWHGAGWTFVVWGALHGGYLVAHHLWRRLAGARPATAPGRLRRAAGIGATFLCVAVGWAFFRADSLATAVRLLGGMAGAHGLSLSDNLEPLFGFLASWGVRFDGTGTFESEGLRWIALGFLIVWGLPNTQQWMRRPGAPGPAGPAAHIPAWQPRPAAAAVLAVLAVLSLLRLGEVSEFLYFQF